MFSFCSLTATRWEPASDADQAACKPGSVPGAAAPPRPRGMAIPLGRPLPGASRDLPGRPGRKPACPRGGRRPYLVLLPVGFAMPSPLPATRCALTAPFHPDPQAPKRSGAPAGGLLSVALSLGSPPPGITRHRVSVEPGLSSPERAPESAAQGRPSGRLIQG